MQAYQTQIKDLQIAYRQGKSNFGTDFGPPERFAISLIGSVIDDVLTETEQIASPFKLQRHISLHIDTIESYLSLLNGRFPQLLDMILDTLHVIYQLRDAIREEKRKLRKSNSAAK